MFNFLHEKHNSMNINVRLLCSKIFIALATELNVELLYIDGLPITTVIRTSKIKLYEAKYEF